MTTRNENYFVPNFDKYCKYFDEAFLKIKNCDSKDDAIKEMNTLYEFLKQITPEFFCGHTLCGGYNILKRKLIECEGLMPKEFIIESSPNFIPGKTKNNIPVSASDEYILNWLVGMTREFLNVKINQKSKVLIDFNQLDLGNKCEEASNRVLWLCKEIGLKCHKLIIYPGFTTYPQLYDGNGYHVIVVVYLGNEKYIIDCTYRQFFTLAYNNLNRIGLIDISNCRAGIFMTMNDERLNLANQILKRGWFLVTDDNIKNYFDGYAISYRNGLYYQTTNDYSYETTYSAIDYKDFLRKIDSQVKHEGEEVLGFQRTLNLKQTK